MKALVYEGPREMKVRGVDLPIPQDDEVLIEVAYSGICGSELSGYLGRNSLRKPPLIFGHEFSGTIAGVGSRVTQFALGDQVTANPLVTCGQCQQCKRGAQQLCANRRLLSAALPGSNAEFVKIPAQFVYGLGTLSLEQGAFVEPIACAVRAVELANVSPGDAVLVIGMGPIGQLVLQVLLLHGVKNIIVADMNVQRLEQAGEFGVRTVSAREQNVVDEVMSVTSGYGVAVAIDAVGASVTRQQCVACVRPGGTVVFTGLHEEESSLPINKIIRSEVKTVGAFAYSSLNFETAMQFLSDGRVGFKQGVVKASLEDGAGWFETLVGNPGDVTKVLLDPKL